MYTLMLVDDHKIILNGIQMLIKNLDVAFDRFVCANDGAQALSMLEKEQPDAIITDIKMPSMDGLTFCRYIRERKDRFRDIPIILLTGYDNFEYARSGIELRAVRYLLKPVERDELFAALKTVELMLDERVQRPLEACNRNAEIIIQAINGEKLPKTFEEQLILYHILPKERAVSEKLAQTIQEELGNLVRAIYVRTSDILCLSQYSGSFYFSSRLLQQTEINASAVFEGLEYLGDALRQLYIVQLKRGGRMDAQVLSFEEFSHPGESLRLPSSEELQEINTAITFFDQERLLKALGDLEHKLKEKKNSAEIAITWYSAVCMSVYKHFYDYISQPNMSEEFNYLLYSEILLTKERDEEKMSRFMRERLTIFLTRFRENNQKSIVEQAKLLLRNNPTITQQELAEALHITSQYFSKLFRQETGEVFSNYIIRQRINTAKEYLISTNLTVEQVGQKVGYASEKHFYTVFRRMTGMSPAKYRRLHTKI